ncbi:MAG: DUF4435 domain-containing protein [Pedobacter sp.]
MSDPIFTLKVITEGGEQQIKVTNNKPLFVLGANGVGKSTLMQNLYMQYKEVAKRIIAHRQGWFTSNGIAVTSSQKVLNEGYIKNADNTPESRYKDDYSVQRTDISIFDLVSAENQRSRTIAEAADSGDLNLVAELSSNQGAINSINELLSASNINVKIKLEQGDLLFASKNGSAPYSVAKLSDGERNALLICADIMTAPAGTIFIIDEPERHLHRSIISPLLTSLFQKRPDCSFVISTHDITLPVDQTSASVLLVRGCEWQGNTIKSWNIDLIEDTSLIPDNIKLDILGAKQKMLFVEGDNKSLDKQIYQLIYPEVSVISMNDSSSVEKAVTGIRKTSDLHWISAYGLVDADDRTDSQISALNSKGIAATQCYSVESLYYHTDTIKRVASALSIVSGEDENIIYEKATAKVINSINIHRTRMCARLCEKQARLMAMTNLPDHNDIASGAAKHNVEIDLAKLLQEETSKFDKLVANGDINGLISRYPIRETGIIKEIIEGLGIKKDRYESMVRTSILKDDTKNFYRNLLKPLTNLIEKKTHSVINEAI